MKKRVPAITVKSTLPALALAMACAAFPAAADRLHWTVSFDIVDGATPEHVSLSFATTDTLQPNANNTFLGYLIDYTTVSGYHGEHTVIGLQPGGFYNVNDNLINPRGGVPFGQGGLAYQDTSNGQQYQLFYNGRLSACSSTCYAPNTASPFAVTNFSYAEGSKSRY